MQVFIDVPRTEVSVPADRVGAMQCKHQILVVANETAWPVTSIRYRSQLTTYFDSSPAALYTHLRFIGHFAIVSTLPQ